MPLNLREIRARRRGMLRGIGDELRSLRTDAGMSQAAVARAAGVSPAHLCGIEAGAAPASIEVMLRLGAVLGADLSVRYFPTTGPRLRDRHQLAQAEGILAILGPGWGSIPELAVYRPVRGVIDLVLEERRGDTVASELQSELRRVEQQVRWARQKADALAALPEQHGRRVSRLLVLRDTRAMREVVDAADGLLRAAYPARTGEAVASLRGERPWPAPRWCGPGTRVGPRSCSMGPREASDSVADAGADESEAAGPGEPAASW